MNTFWLIHDDGESEKFSNCLHQLENDGKTSVLSSGFMEIILLCMLLQLH
jgi:hypothetical protein